MDEQCLSDSLVETNSADFMECYKIKIKVCSFWLKKS